MTQTKLPPEAEDHVIEFTLRHVILSFGGLVVGVLAVGTGIVLARDYGKYKRQKAIIDAASELIKTLQEGNSTWKEKKKDISSVTKK